MDGGAGTAARLTDNTDIVLNLYRIENVRTAPAERITVNDEERQRQGFDLQTTFRWARRDSGQPDFREVLAVDAEGTVARLRYGPGAEISRLNKGLRRREVQSEHGFMINPLNGFWAKVEEDDDEPDPTKTANQPIVPWVLDRKNALLLQLAEPDTNETTIATLQYALKRGIESVYQLEESELLAEPLPDRKTRRGVLFYEATEGGAGVLTRLVHDPDALARVAHAALRILHLNVPAFGSPMPPLDGLVDVDNTQCVAGCYRCLLSYYNQPDHPVIDRRDRLARELLLRLPVVLSPHDETKPLDSAQERLKVRTEAGETLTPLLEAKHVAIFDHRWSSGLDADLVSDDQKRDTNFLVTPRYWMSSSRTMWWWPATSG